MRTHPGRLKLGVALLGTSVALAAAGCGGDEDEDPGAAGAAGARGFSVEFAQSYCRALAPCCTFGGYGFNTSACEFAVSGYLDALIATFDEYPGVALDLDAARTCAEAFRAAAEACTDRELARSVDPACAGVFQGVLPQGARCSSGAECAPLSDGAFAECRSGVCAPGERASVPGGVHGGLGETCGQTCSDSEDLGYSCSGASAEDAESVTACWTSEGLLCSKSGVCVAEPGVGEACPDRRCGPNAFCLDGSCYPGTATGPCPTATECLTTSYCDSDTRTCVPIKANGAHCEKDWQCQSKYCEGDLCRDWSLAKPSTCAGLLDF